MVMEHIPIVASVDDLPGAIDYAERVESSRWYIMRRATVLKKFDEIPKHWYSNEPVTASALVASAAAEAGAFSADDIVDSVRESLVDYTSGATEMEALTASLGEAAWAAHVSGVDVQNETVELVQSFTAAGRLEVEEQTEIFEALTAAVRRVATPEGADFYGQPIGSVIVPNVYLPTGSKGVGGLNVGDFIEVDSKKLKVDSVDSGAQLTKIMATDEDGKTHEISRANYETVKTYKSAPKGAKASLGDSAPKAVIHAALPKDRVPTIAEAAAHLYGTDSPEHKQALDIETRNPPKLMKPSPEADPSLLNVAEMSDEDLVAEYAAKNGNHYDKDEAYQERVFDLADEINGRDLNIEEADHGNVVRPGVPLGGDDEEPGGPSLSLADAAKMMYGEGSEKHLEAIRISAPKSIVTRPADHASAGAANPTGSNGTPPAQQNFIDDKSTSLGTIDPGAKGTNPERFTPKVTFADGSTPKAGNRVRDKKGRLGTVEETYQAYTAIRWDDTGKVQTVKNDRINSTGGTAPTAAPQADAAGKAGETTVKAIDNSPTVDTGGVAKLPDTRTPNPIATLSESSHNLLKVFIEDAGNWSGNPWTDGNVGMSASERGNLTDLKRKKLVVTGESDGDAYIVFTDKGLAYARAEGWDVDGSDSWMTEKAAGWEDPSTVDPLSKVTRVKSPPVADFGWQTSRVGTNAKESYEIKGADGSTLGFIQRGYDQSDRMNGRIRVGRNIDRRGWLAFTPEQRVMDQKGQDSRMTGYLSHPDINSAIDTVKSRAAAKAEIKTEVPAPDPAPAPAASAAAVPAWAAKAPADDATLDYRINMLESEDMHGNTLASLLQMRGVDLSTIEEEEALALVDGNNYAPSITVKEPSYSEVNVNTDLARRALGLPKRAPIADNTVSVVNNLTTMETRMLNNMLRPGAAIGGRAALLRKASLAELQSLYKSAYNSYLHTQDRQSSWNSIVNALRKEILARGAKPDSSDTRYTGQN